MKTALILPVALIVGLSPAAARMGRASADDVLQAACYPDVQRLCKDAMPDEKKVTACMTGKKSQISRKCAEAYRQVHGKRR